MMMLLTGGTGMAGSGLLGAIQAGFGARTTTPVSKQALGGDYTVSSPTLFMAGDAGPERATFQPIGGSDRSSSGGTNNYTVNVTVHAAGVVSDITQFASKVGQQIAREIRGAGQVGLVRT